VEQDKMPYLEVVKLSQFHSEDRSPKKLELIGPAGLITTCSGKVLLRLDNMSAWVWTPVADKGSRLLIHGDIWDSWRLPDLPPSGELLLPLWIRTADSMDLPGSQQMLVKVPVAPLKFDQNVEEVPFWIGELLLKQFFEFDDIRARDWVKKRKDAPVCQDLNQT
jgi:hypothetical protein